MAPKRRLQVEGVEAPKLRPSAQPVDRFAPDENASSGLDQLAGALSEFAPSLSRFAHKKLEGDRKEAQMEGQAQAQARFEEFRQSADGFREAVRSGEIPEWDNPWFRLGFQEMSGRMLSDSYGAELSVAMQEVLEDEGTTDPNEFDRVAQEVKEGFLEQHLGEDADAALAGSFARSAQALEGGLRRQFAAQAGKNMVEQSFDNIYTLTTSVLQQDISQEEQVHTLELEMDRAVRVGMNPSRLNETVATAVLNEAVRTGDDTKLALLTQIRTNKAAGARLSGIPDIGSQIAQARNSIRAENSAVRGEEIARRKDAVTVARLDLSDSVTERIREAQEAGEDPRNLDFEDLRRDFALQGVENAPEVIEEITAGYLGTHENQKDAVLNTTLGIWDDTRLDNPIGRQHILGLLRDRRINQGGYNYLANEIKLRDETYGIGGSSSGKSAVRDEDFSYMMTGFTQTYEPFLNIPGIGQGAGRIINEARSKIHRRWTRAYANGADELGAEQKGLLISAIVGQVVEDMAAEGPLVSDEGQPITMGNQDDPRPEFYWSVFGSSIPDHLWEEIEGPWRNTSDYQVSPQLARTLLMAGVPPNPSPQTIQQFYRFASRGRER